MSRILTNLFSNRCPASSQFLPRLVGSVDSPKSPSNLSNRVKMVLRALGVAIGHISSHRLGRIIATSSRRWHRDQPLLPTEVSPAHERLMRVAVRIEIPAWPRPVIRHLASAMTLRL